MSRSALPATPRQNRTNMSASKEGKWEIEAVRPESTAVRLPPATDTALLTGHLPGCCKPLTVPWVPTVLVQTAACGLFGVSVGETSAWNSICLLGPDGASPAGTILSALEAVCPRAGSQQGGLSGAALLGLGLVCSASGGVCSECLCFCGQWSCWVRASFHRDHLFKGPPPNTAPF